MQDLCLSWGKASTEFLTLSPLPQNRVGRKHKGSDVTFPLSVGHGQRLQGLYTERLLPHGNGSWHPKLCAKAGHWMIHETIATKKRKEPPFLTELCISLKHFLFLGQTINMIFKTGLKIRLQYHCIPKRTPVPLASAKWVPKMWRKLKILGGPNTEMQITHIPIASLAFPLAGKLPETVSTRFLTEGCACKHSGQFLRAFPTWTCSAVWTPETLAVHSSKLRAFPPPRKGLLFLYFLLFFMGNLLPPFVKQFSIPVSSPLLWIFTFANNLQ